MPDEVMPDAPATPPEAPQPTPSEPIETPLVETQPAQIPASEPLPPEPEPIETPEPPSATASTPVSLTPTPAPTSLPLTAVTHAAHDLLVKARATIQTRKQKKLAKIMEALNTKNKITNDEVEKLLHVSDATATRYLSALEKEGKIQQVGKTGTGVVYSKI